MTYSLLKICWVSTVFKTFNMLCHFIVVVVVVLQKYDTFLERCGLKMYHSKKPNPTNYTASLKGV